VVVVETEIVDVWLDVYVWLFEAVVVSDCVNVDWLDGA